ncbi:MAG: transglycosylase SLT domain-containing protein, partial [Acetobacteraceae bacterium]
PQPLSPATAARIRRIFALQAAGRMAEAARETAGLRNRLLLGHILADKYLGPYHHSTPAELAAWLHQYPRLPEAPAIRALLASRLPRGWTLPAVQAPVALPRPGVVAGRVAPAPPPRSSIPGLARNPWLDERVAALGASRHFSAALSAIRNARISRLYGASLRATLAQSMLFAGRYAEALRVASGAIGEAGGRVGMAGFVAGLAAWRVGQPDRALVFFRQAARAPAATAELRSAAAFWAARAALHAHKPDAYLPWMERAARDRWSFYGMLARHLLGRDVALFPGSPRATLGEADVAAIDATAAGRRAFALLEVGKSALAEAELRDLWPLAAHDPPLARAVMLVAAHLGMVDLVAPFASAASGAAGRALRLAGLPMPTLSPRGGFRVDPALVYALTRIESDFNPRAHSGAGAQGLMQLMPATARAIGGSWAELADPGGNLALGQRYLLYLAQQGGIENNLLRVLASYNDGPGNFLRWKPDVRAGGDPLLFLESIPNPETRRFVRQALTYSWGYAAQLGVPAPSLDRLAEGRYPALLPAASPGLASAAAAP